MLRVCGSIVARYADIPRLLDEAHVAYSVCGDLNSCVRWRDEHASRETVATVWDASECMALMRANTLSDRVSAKVAPGCLLILVGSVAGIEQCAGWLSLDLGVSVRRAANAHDLANVLIAAATALGRASAAPSTCEDFLHGLTASDALYNRTKPRDAEAAWLGALRQVLSEDAAAAVHVKWETAQVAQIT